MMQRHRRTIVVISAASTLVLAIIAWAFWPSTSAPATAIAASALALPAQTTSTAAIPSTTATLSPDTSVPVVTVTVTVTARPTPPAATSTAPATPTPVYTLSEERVDAATRRRVMHCGNDTPDVWLTFDDQEDLPGQADAILKVLKDNDVQAHFFLIGTWADANPAVVARIKAAGHIIENHTLSHNLDFWKLDDAGIKREIDGGPTPTSEVRLLRPPGGNGAFTTRLGGLAAAQGYQLCYWTVDTRDWDGMPAQDIIRRVRDGDSASSNPTPRVEAGGVVLMHINGKHTAEALPGVIAAIRDRGLTLANLP